MSKIKDKASSHHKGSISTRSKAVNSHGYNVANFNVLYIPVQRESEIDRLVSVNKQSSKKTNK